jgi:CTP:molybdopterin cytidylyltransferase MocA
VIATVVHSLARCPIDAILVVAGPHVSALAEELGITSPPDPLPGAGRGKGLTGLARPTGCSDSPPRAGEGLGERLSLVQNPAYRDGMLTSVRCGVRAASPETSWFLVALVDQPSIDPSIVTGLIETAQNAAPEHRIILPTFEGRRGHPLLFHASLGPEVLTLSGEIGLRELMQRHPDEILHVPVANDSVLRDIDTPDQYERELQRSREESR